MDIFAEPSPMPHTQGSVCPTRHFRAAAAGQAKVNLC